MTGPAVTAVVADGSPSARGVLVEVLRGAGVEVIGEAADGTTVADLVCELRPSVVVMDCDLPGVDGLEATTRIMAEAPTPIVILTAHSEPADVAVTMRAVRLGALTVQPKPAGSSGPAPTRLGALVRAMADVKVVGRRAGRGAGRPRPAAPASAAPIRVVGVGASTGGPAALFELLSALSPGLTVPVLVVQHLPDGFTEGFVRWLRGASALPLKEAVDGERLQGRTVYFGPHGRHLQVVAGGRVRLGDGPALHGFRPSVSALFSSLAEVYGSAAAGVVLTGMGTDGLDGARTLRSSGGVVLVQDEATSAVFGMPRAVSEAGLADLQGSVGVLAREINERSRGRGRGAVGV